MSERKMTSVGRRNIAAAGVARRRPLVDRLAALGPGEALDVSNLAMGKAARKIKSPSGKRLTSRHTKYGGIVNGRMVVASSKEALGMAYTELGLSAAEAGRVWEEDFANYQSKLQAQYDASAARKAAYRKGKTVERATKIKAFSPGTAAIYQKASAKSRKAILSGRTAVLKSASAGSVPASTALLG
jgi:hypothetical protein